jgi:hypothetical protein
MSDAESDSQTSSRRAALKQLQFSKSQELKKAKFKNDKKLIEEKYAKLENELLGHTTDSLPTQPTQSAPLVLYSDTPKEISKSQKRKEEKQARLEERKHEIVKQVGDGSLELALKEEEMNAIKSRIPKGFQIRFVEADGDCMFSSMCASVPNTSVADLRNRIADYLLSNREEFEMFLDSDDCSFEDYCDSLRANRWGSDVELEACARLLRVPIAVFTANNVLKFGEQFEGNGSPVVRLSFHRHQLTSCHYNAVVPLAQSPNSSVPI